MVKAKYKIHLISSGGPKSVCGIVYPMRQTEYFWRVVTCKRCKATYEYRADVEAEKDIAYEKEK